MKACKYIIPSLIAIICFGCSTGDDIESPVEPVVTPEEPTTSNVYFDNNRWIYAAMNEHYLWRQDLPDSVACDYDTTPADLFKSLLSDKDRFSYILDNPYYSPEQRNRGGLSYQTYEDGAGNRAELVLYVTDSGLSRGGLKRGDWIKIVSEEPTALTYRRVRLGTDNKFEYIPGDIRLALSDQMKGSTVLLDTIYRNRTGYLCYTEYDEIEDLEGPLRKFQAAGIENLILDLRYNPGGYVRTCRYLCNSIAPAEAYGDIFQVTRYNDLISKQNKLETGREELISRYLTPGMTDLEMEGHEVIPLNLRRLYVITSRHTASASEATIVCLRPYMEVVIVGETTVGKGVGSYTVYNRNYKYAIQPITMRYYNKNGETVTDEGLTPDVYAADGYSTSKKRIGELDEPLLQTTMSLIDMSMLETSTESTDDTTVRKRAADEGMPGLNPVGAPSNIEHFAKRGSGYDEGVRYAY